MLDPFDLLLDLVLFLEDLDDFQLRHHPYPVLVLSNQHKLVLELDQPCLHNKYNIINTSK